MLKALFRARMAALSSWITGSSRTKKSQSKGKLIGFSLLMLYALCAFGFLFWQIFSSIALPFKAVGLEWLYFSMAALMSFALMFVGSVFTSKAQLYEARDNDLLLSLPIKPEYILISRMFMLWVITFVFGLVPAAPAILIWGLQVGYTGVGLAACLLIFVLMLPLFALAVAALFGWLLSIITARMGNKSLITVVLSLIFLGAYMYGAFRMNSLITALAQNPDGAARVLGAVTLLYWIGEACARGDITALLLTALIMVAAFALTYLLLSRTFIKTATDRRGGPRKKYVEREEKTFSPKKALFHRELQQFLSSATYILNCGLGAFMALIGAVVLVIKRDALLSLPMYDMMAPMLQLLFIVGLCFFAATILITAPSVSLEGKSLWIAQSMPVETGEILRAKLRLHNIIAVPPLLVCSAAAAWVLKPNVILLLSMLALPAVFGVFVGLVGLAENLRHPNLDWMNETQAVKSGFGVLFTMLISWGVMAVPVLCYLFLGDKIAPEAICLAFLLLLVLLCLLLYRWLMSRGAELYRAL